MRFMPHHLRGGYHAFREDRYKEHARRFQALADGQSPKIMIIACADSRVDPAEIFALGPGEVFIVRNVAALVPPVEESAERGFHGTSAALEYAVTVLEVEHIVVMGHGQCGGIGACLSTPDSKSLGTFIGPWVAQLEEVRDKVMDNAGDLSGDDRQHLMEHHAVRYSLANLRKYSFVKEAMDNQGLLLHGAWFSIGEGALHWLDRATDSFLRVDHE